MVVHALPPLRPLHAEAPARRVGKPAVEETEGDWIQILLPPELNFLRFDTVSTFQQISQIFANL